MLTFMAIMTLSDRYSMKSQDQTKLLRMNIISVRYLSKSAQLSSCCDWLPLIPTQDNTYTAEHPIWCHWLKFTLVLAIASSVKNLPHESFEEFCNLDYQLQLTYCSQFKNVAGCILMADHPGTCTIWNYRHMPLAALDICTVVEHI